jgi:hypothetical protein
MIPHVGFKAKGIKLSDKRLELEENNYASNLKLLPGQ